MNKLISLIRIKREEKLQPKKAQGKRIMGHVALIALFFDIEND